MSSLDSVGGKLVAKSNIRNVAGRSIELVLDPNFQAPITVNPNCPDVNVDPNCVNSTPYTIQTPSASASNPSSWIVGQVGSHATVPAQGSSYNGGYYWANQYKHLAVFPNGRVELGMNGESEFGGTYPSGPLNNPMLTLNQNVSVPGVANYHPSGSVGAMSSLVVTVDAQLIYDQRNISPGYVQSNNAAIFPLSLVVQKLTPGPGYGELIVVQVPIYDDRVAIPGIYAFLDAATHNFETNAPYSAFAQASLHGGQLVHFSGDILPYIQNAFSQATADGVLTSTDINDYQIGSFSIGFELSGLNNTAIQFQNLSLMVNLPDVPAVSTPSSVFGLIGSAIFKYNGQGGFDNIPGALSKISVGADGSAWGLDAGGNIYQYDGQGGFNRVAGNLAQIAVGNSNAVWGLSGDGRVWQYNGQGGFNNVAGFLSSIAVGADGAVWGLSGDGRIWQYNGQGGFNSIPGYLTSISVGNGSAIWGYNNVGQIFQYNNAGGWNPIAGWLTQISVGSDGSVFGINGFGSIFQYAGNGGWNQLPGSLQQIQVQNANSVWGLNSDGAIYSLNSQNSWVNVPGQLSTISAR